MLRKLKEAEEIIAGDRQEVEEALIKLAASDLMLFWGTERELVKKQEKLWKPIIAWLEEAVLNANIRQTQSLEVPKQASSLSGSFARFLKRLDNRRLAVFYVATITLRSVLLAIAFVEGKVTAEEAFDAAFIEELWQNESWGTVDDAAKRQGEIRGELRFLEKYLKDEKAA